MRFRLNHSDMSTMALTFCNLRPRPLKFLPLLLILGVTAAAAGDDPFAPANAIDAPKAAKGIDDPFAPANAIANKKPRGPAAARVKEISKKRPPTADRIDFQVSVEPTKARRGETVKLAINGKPRPGFHTYPITQKTPNQDKGFLT